MTILSLPILQPLFTIVKIPSAQIATVLSDKSKHKHLARIRQSTRSSSFKTLLACKMGPKTNARNICGASISNSSTKATTAGDTQVRNSMQFVAEEGVPLPTSNNQMQIRGLRGVSCRQVRFDQICRVDPGHRIAQGQHFWSRR
jgi:hypothetical protein